jgi:hypothetical protein
LAATGKSSTQIDLEWDTVTGASSYKIYRALSQNGTYSYIGTASTTSYSNPGLSANTTYWYKVSAINSEGEGAPSVEASGKTLEETWQEWPSKIDVPIDKTWTIEFNYQLDPNSITTENIYVLNENDVKIEVEVAVNGGQGKSVLVKAPAEGYMIGGTYTLYITKGVKSEAGKIIINPVRMNFTVGQ